MNSNSIVYIEIPNSERYDLMQYDVPLQEINIEHINFFSKHSLAKLMILNNFTPICIEDCSFEIKNNTKYHVIRSMFRLNTENVGFDKYLIDEQSKLDKIKSFFLRNPQKKMYLYGAGAFTCKIIGEFKSNITGVIDDNPYYLGKSIAGFNVINYNMFKAIVNENDAILVTIIFSSNKIKDKLMTSDKSINVMCIEDIPI
jgi:FlaA1/EpsC-like NDP-sugar epimerase